MSSKCLKLFLICAFLFFPSSALVHAQIDPSLEPWNTYTGPPDNINLGYVYNGVHLNIPLLKDRGRGQSSMQYSLQYQTPGWSPYGVATGLHEMPLGTGYFGWQSALEVPTQLQGTIYPGTTGTPIACPEDPDPTVGPWSYTYNNWIYQDPNGFLFQTNISITDSHACQGGSITATPASSDVAGYHFAAVTNATEFNVNVTTLDGANYYNSSGAFSTFGYSSPITIYSDSNGNQAKLTATSDSSHLVNTITSASGAQYTTTLTYAYVNDQSELSSFTISYTDSNGKPQTTLVNFQPYTIQTNFQIAGTTEYGPETHYLVQSVNYSDGSSYQFGYEQTPGYPGSTTGRLTQVTLPTGGAISYQYLGSFSPAIADSSYILKRTTSDGTTTYVQTELGSTGYSNTTVTDPEGNDTYLTFYTAGFPGNYVEVGRNNYQGSMSAGKLLSQTTHCYAPTAPTSCATGSYTYTPGYGAPATVTVQRTLPSGAASKTVTTYNASGLVGEVDEYDFGASAPAINPTRQTITSYASLGNNINNRPQSVTIKDGSGNVATVTSYSYDGTSVVASPATYQPASIVGTARGNVTTVTQQRDSGGTGLSTTYVNDVAGMPTKVTDPNGNITTYTYDSSGASVNTTDWLTASGMEVNYISHASTTNFDLNTGVLTSSTDANNQTTTYTHDSVGRLTDTSYPKINGVNGDLSICYVFSGGSSGSGCSSSPNNTIKITTAATPNPSQTSSQQVDGLGRVVTSTLANSSSITTSYDGNGNVSCVSQPGSTATTCTYYDALGRPYLQTLPDLSTRYWCYDNVAVDPNNKQTCSPQLGTPMNGTWVDYVDEAGHYSQKTYNAFNQLIKVLEPDPSSNTPSMETDYSYNTNGDLVAVNQLGNNNGDSARVRTFTYDFLHRLICASNPETGSGNSCPSSATGAIPSGVITYSYDGAGNVHTRTDARSITTTYTYDAMNRLVSKASSDTTPTSCYQYDGASANQVGRLIKEWTQSPMVSTCSSPGTTYLSLRSISSYDAAGFVTSEQQCVKNVCTPASPSGGSQKHDVAGNLTYWYDWFKDIGFTQASDSAGRPATVTSTWVDASHPSSLFNTSATQGYTASDGLQTWILGNNLQLSRTYDSRFRVTSESAKHP